MDLHFYALFGIVAFVLSRMATKISRKAKLYPPGPPPFPFIGTVSLLWERKPWLRFEEWKNIYGPVVHFKILNQHIIVLNTHDAALDLLGRRSKIYNGRPRSILIDEFMTKNLAFPLISYGDLWKRHRRAAQTVLNLRAVERYHGIQERQAQKLDQNLLQNPGDWRQLTKDSLYNLFSSIGYTEDHSDESASSYLEAFMTRIVHAAIPGSSITDFLPFLASLPDWLLPPKKRRLAQFQTDDKQFEAFISNQESEDEEEQDSMGQNLLRNRRENEMTIQESAWLTAVLCAIGGEVTASVLPIFFLAMTLYPEVQQRAHLELDQIVGRDRSPTFQDRNQLPYIQAIVREVLRWRPVGPIGFPRSCLQDDYYQGYLIPAGSIVVPNIWAMNRDPQLYPDYERFNPERFLLDSKLSNIPGVHGQGHASYGFGDRVCSGLHVANDALFINIATILHSFDISKLPGSTMDPQLVFEDFGIVTRPGDFSCKITKRSIIDS